MYRVLGSRGASFANYSLEILKASIPIMKNSSARGFFWCYLEKGFTDFLSCILLPKESFWKCLVCSVISLIDSPKTLFYNSTSLFRFINGLYLFFDISKGDCINFSPLQVCSSVFNSSSSTSPTIIYFIDNFLIFPC